MSNSSEAVHPGIDWFRNDPAIEIQFDQASLPKARYALASTPREGDAPLFHQPYQPDLSDADLPACIVPIGGVPDEGTGGLHSAQNQLETNSSLQRRLETAKSRFADIGGTREITILVPSRGEEKRRGKVRTIKGLWVQDAEPREIISACQSLDLSLLQEPLLQVQEDTQATVINPKRDDDLTAEEQKGGDSSPQYLVPLPRVVLPEDALVADNTDPLRSMGRLLKRFVQRFGEPDHAVDHVRIATGYLYHEGLRQVLDILENPNVKSLQLLFSGQTDRRTAQNLTGLFGENLSGAIEEGGGALWQRCAEAVQEGRLEVKVYTHAFLHAKLFTGGEGRNEQGQVIGGHAVVGSSNVSGSGFGSQGNLELNVTVQQTERVTRLTDWFERRWEEASEPNPPLFEVLQQRRPQTGVPEGDGAPDPQPMFETPGLLDVWKAGQHGTFDPPEDHLRFLAQRHRERIEKLTVLDGPVFPGDDSRRIDPSPEQSSGAKALAQRLVDTRVAFLADSVGLGKTITALGTAWYLQRLGRVSDAAVISPSKLFGQWQDDARAIGMPEGVLSYRNRHKLERLETEEAAETLDYDLIIVEEAHATLRNRENKLWKHLREVLSQNRRSMLLLVSATPWNNSREDIYNYLRLAWADGRILRQDFQALSTEPLKNYLSIFHTQSAATGARTFGELSLERYREIFRSVFVQRTRHTLESTGRETPDFPRRLVRSSLTPSSKEHDQFYSSLEAELADLDLPHYQPFEALQRAAVATDGLPSDSAPPPSNLHGSFLIQLYKRAESSLFALAVSLETMDRKLGAFEETLRSIQEAPAPKEKLQEWLRENYLDLDREAALGEDESLGLGALSKGGEGNEEGFADEAFTFSPEEWMSPDEKRRWANMQSLLGELSDEDTKEAIRYLIDVEVTPERTQIQALQKRLTFGLERGDPKPERLLELLAGHLEKGDKTIAVGEFVDTAVRFFISATQRFPEKRAALALGGGEAWIYEPNRHQPDPLSEEEWEEAIALSPSGRRSLLLSQSDRARPIDRSDALALFAPEARGTEDDRLQSAGGEVDFLVGSEAISVGQNLQDASALIQLDLPWNPMVIEQRIGRIDRRGGGRAPRGSEPEGKPVVEVHYCWSPRAIEEEVSLRQRLRRKAKRAMEDTNFDELLLFELKNHIDQVQRERGVEAAKEEANQFLERRQQQLASRQSEVPGINERGGSDLDGLRQLAVDRGTWATSDGQPTPVVAGRGLSDDEASRVPRWLVTVELCPIGEQNQSLGGSILAHLPVSIKDHQETEISEGRSEEGRSQADRLASNLGLVVQRLRAATPEGDLPNEWTAQLTKIDRRLQHWRGEVLKRHNERAKEKLERQLDPSQRASATEELKQLAVRAEDRLKNTAVSIAEQDENALQSIEERLLFLLDEGLQRENLSELLINRNVPELKEELHFAAERPEQVLTEEFEETFEKICGGFYDRTEKQENEEKALEENSSEADGQLEMRDADLSGPWEDLDIEVLALTYVG
ncbi:helicase-related protein [Salinibacter ruber]|uniref:helicase-related protein n=1 Tax=Salinibacter ruber TaxID=146919 RepID=UPI002169E34E|nr:helicase-related protein [Salinibacter ruber]MCS3685416.1 superfamily II DNA or RNA helicase [Salinibacter ruber]MCS3698601.1 superfamily II DNA or RNA helicase [Salinibacter ruber]